MKVRVRKDNQILSNHQELFYVIADELEEDYEQDGTIERLQSLSTNISLAFGRLVEILAEKNIITLSDVTRITGTDELSWPIEFVKEGELFANERPKKKKKGKLL